MMGTMVAVEQDVIGFAKTHLTSTLQMNWDQLRHLCDLGRNLI